MSDAIDYIKIEDGVVKPIPTSNLVTGFYLELARDPYMDMVYSFEVREIKYYVGKDGLVRVFRCISDNEVVVYDHAVQELVFKTRDKAIKAGVKHLKFTKSLLNQIRGIVIQHINKWSK